MCIDSHDENVRNLLLPHLPLRNDKIGEGQKSWMLLDTKEKKEMMRGAYNLMCNVHSSSNVVVVFCFLFSVCIYSLHALQW